MIFPNLNHGDGPLYFITFLVRLTGSTKLSLKLITRILILINLIRHYQYFIHIGIIVESNTFLSQSFNVFQGS